MHESGSNKVCVSHVIIKVKIQLTSPASNTKQILDVNVNLTSFNTRGYTCPIPSPTLISFTYHFYLSCLLILLPVLIFSMFASLLFVNFSFIQSFNSLSHSFSYSFRCRKMTIRMYL